MSLVIPSLFVIIITIAAAKKINVFSSFCAGAEEGFKFTLTLLPIIAAVFMMCNLMEVSGIADALARALSPAMNALGIPGELAKLAIVKPFSGRIRRRQLYCALRLHHIFLIRNGVLRIRAVLCRNK